MRRLCPPWFAVIGLWLSAAAGAQTYLGPETCKACHEEAYRIWKEGPHAHATQSLQGRQAADGQCLSCHSPQADKGLAGITCETCHGAGQYYSPSYVMKDSELSRAVGLEDPGEKSCRACHDASSPSLKAFEFKEKVKEIDHWSADRKERQSAAEREFLKEALGLSTRVPRLPPVASAATPSR